MRLAVNYSLRLEELLQQNLVDCDLLKCPEWKGVVSNALELRPVYIHFEIVAGNNSLENLDMELIREMLKLTDTPHLNCHLFATPDLDPDSASDRRDLLKTWIREMRFLQDTFTGIRLVAENLPFVPDLRGSHISALPDLIHEALLEADADLLLDLSHARISASYLGMDSQAYIARLPLERLRELHITGLRTYHGTLTDHFEMQAEDWQAADWAKAQIDTGAWREPQIVAFEYGGVGDVFGWRTEKWALREQVPQLRALFPNGNRPK